MITGIHHVGLASAEFTAAASVFGRLCGSAHGQGERLWFDGAGLRVALEPAPAGLTPRAVHEPGITHVCLQSRDGPRLRDTLLQAGVVFHAEPTGLGTGYRYAYGALPGGGVIESETAPHLPDAPEAWFSHVAFATADLPRLSRFYANLLGLSVEMGPRLHGRPGLDKVTGQTDVDVSAAWVSGLNLGLEFWQYHHPPTRPTGPRAGFSYLAFSVSDVAAAQSRAAALGCAELKDPDGNPFLFIREERPGHGLNPT